MNTLYTKVLLYAYPSIESLIDQIDELVDKKAVSSMDACLSCQEICHSIIALIKEKDLYLDLMVILDEIFENLTEEEMKCIEYKYFRIRDKEWVSDFDYSSKQYFRKQNRILDKIRSRLVKKGLDDTAFKEKFLSVKFFKSLLHGVKEREKTLFKNRKENFNVQQNKKAWA